MSMTTKHVSIAVPEPVRIRVRPAPGGASIGIAGGQPGTLGCLVRDSDGSVQILTTAGAVTHGGTSGDGVVVYQPAPAGAGSMMDAIGTVTRAVQLSTRRALYPPLTEISPVVDAALVRPTDPSFVADATFDSAVPAGSRLHPMVGLIVGTAIDLDGGFSYVALPMQDVLDALEVTPWRPGSVVAPVVGRSITFVGAGGGTRPGRIDRIGLDDVAVRYAHPDGPALGLVSNAFRIRADVAQDEDIGAVVYTWAGKQVGRRCTGCLVASDLERVYDVPFTQDVALADAIRDDFLIPTKTGSMLVQLFYKNEDQFRARLTTVSPTEAELDYARLLYDRYVQIVRDEIADVAMTRVPVTDEVLDDVRAAVYGLSRFMSVDEYGACQDLLELLEEIKGFTIRQGIDHMNDGSTVDRVHTILESVPGWDTTYDAD